MKPYNLLIVDDDLDDQLLLKLAFKDDSINYKLLFVSSVDEFIERVPLLPAVPDLILLDINMPVINGFEALTFLKNSPLYRQIPVIMLTTSEIDSDVDRAYDLGASGFITKPDSHVELLKIVEHIRLFWFGVARIPSRLM
ncbi:response regulator [Spirosoma gilvum]